MNLRRCFVPRQLIFLLAAALLISSSGAALGQETITLRSGQTQQVRILGVTPAGIKVQIGEAEMVQPFSNLSAVTMSAPPEFAAAPRPLMGRAICRRPHDCHSLVTRLSRPADGLGPRIDAHARRYLRRPRPVAPGPGGLQGLPRAYPAGEPLTSTSASPASTSPTRITTPPTPKSPRPRPGSQARNLPQATAALIGRAFICSGRIKEQSGDYSGALEDYLRTVTIFPEDRVAAAGAQAAADALRKEHGTTVP